jgi:hypothetical protein
MQPNLYPKDSISRSVPSDNLYSFIRRDPTPRISITTDTLNVSPQMRLERDVQAKFIARNFQLPSDKLIFIARAGKILFFAMALPPYLTFYTLPRWVFVQLMPNVLQLSLQFNQTLNKICKDLFKRTLERMQGITHAFAHVRNKVVEGLQKSIEYLRSINKAVAAGIVNLKHQLIALNERLIQPFHQLKHTLVRHLGNAKVKVHEFFEKVKETTQHTYQTIVDKVQQVIDPVVAWIAPYIERGTTFIKETNEWIKAVHHKVKAKVMPHIEKTSEAVQAFLAPIQKAVYDQVQPVINWFAVQANTLREIAKKSQESLVKWLSAKMEIMNEKAQRAVTFVVQHANAMFNTCLQKLRNMNEFLANKRLKRWLKGKKDNLNKHREKLKALVVKKTQALKDKAYERFQKTKEYVLSRIKRAFLWTLTKIKEAPAKIRKSLIQAFYATLRGWRNFVYGSRVLLAWIRVLLRYGMIRLRELSSELISDP